MRIPTHLKRSQSPRRWTTVGAASPRTNITRCKVSGYHGWWNQLMLSLNRSKTIHGQSEDGARMSEASSAKTSGRRGSAIGSLPSLLSCHVLLSMSLKTSRATSWLRGSRLGRARRVRQSCWRNIDLRSTSPNPFRLGWKWKNMEEQKTVGTATPLSSLMPSALNVRSCV